MKKTFIIIIMIAIMIICMTSCSNNKPLDNSSDVKDPVVTLLVITEIRENVLIGVSNEQSARFSIPNWFKEYNVQPNEIIKVWHSGIFLETWPMQFGDIFSMEYLSLTGETIVVEKNEMVNNKVFVQKYNGVLPINKKLLDDDANLIVQYISSLQENNESLINNYDYILKINNVTYYYNSEFGILMHKELNLKYLVIEKDSMNVILQKYLGGVYNG